MNPSKYYNHAGKTGGSSYLNRSMLILLLTFMFNHRGSYGLPISCTDTRRARLLSSQEDESYSAACAATAYDLSLHVDNHIHLLSQPQQNTGVGVTEKCPTLLFHQMSGSKAVEVLPPKEAYYYRADSFPLGNFPLADLLSAYEMTTDELVIEWDVVRKNCASMIHSMMHHLKIPKEASGVYTARKLYEMNETIGLLRSSPYVDSILPEGLHPHEVQDDRLIQYLVDYYIAKQERRHYRSLEETCSICSGGGNITVDPDTPAWTYVTCKLERTDLTCGDVVEQVATLQEGELDCASAQELAAIYCGCEMRPPLDCALCPDGALPSKAVVEQFFVDKLNYQLIPCSTLLSIASSGIISCSETQAVGLTTCGCAPVAQQPCSLCRDGILPSGSLSKEVFPLETCAGLANRVANEEAGSETCGVMQRVFGPYCECSDDDTNADKNPTTCRICGENLLPDPSRILKSPVGSTCLELELQANLNDTCTDARLLGAGVCCASASSCALCPGGTLEDERLTTGDAFVPFESAVLGIFPFPEDFLVEFSTCSSVASYLDTLPPIVGDDPYLENVCVRLLSTSNGACGCTESFCEFLSVDLTLSQDAREDYDIVLSKDEAVLCNIDGGNNPDWDFYIGDAYCQITETTATCLGAAASEEVTTEEITVIAATAISDARVVCIVYPCLKERRNSSEPETCADWFILFRPVCLVIEAIVALIASLLP